MSPQAFNDKKNPNRQSALKGPIMKNIKQLYEKVTA